MSKEATLARLTALMSELAQLAVSDQHIASEIYELVKDDVLDGIEMKPLNNMLSEQ